MCFCYIKSRMCHLLIRLANYFPRETNQIELVPRRNNIYCPTLGSLSILMMNTHVTGTGEWLYFWINTFFTYAVEQTGVSAAIGNEYSVRSLFRFCLPVKFKVCPPHTSKRLVLIENYPCIYCIFSNIVLKYQWYNTKQQVRLILL